MRTTYKSMQHDNTKEINIHCVQDKLQHSILNEVSTAIHISFWSQEAVSRVFLW